MSNVSTGFKNDGLVRAQKISLISLIQLAVGMVSVVMGSFVNAEMSLLGWKASDISIFLGIGIYFEVFRIYFGRLSDKQNQVKPFLILGVILSLFGLLSVPFLILPVGNVWIIGSFILFATGTAVISTLIDSHVTAISNEHERNGVAGTIQGFRLAGFALGGILGFALFSRMSFSLFIGVMAILYSFFSIISLTYISDRERLINTTNHNISIWKVDLNFLKQSTTIMMLVFLLLYPLGLFMQDNVLEPFAINVLNFDKSGVGRLSAIWGIVTLIFVPLGIKLANRYGRIPISVVGQVLAASGLMLMVTSGFTNSEAMFYIGLICFGSGSGLYSVPGIATMFDVASKSPDFLATNLAIFGIIVTISRANAGIISGYLLKFTRENYYVVFTVEALIALISLIPYIYVERRISE